MTLVALSESSPAPAVEIAHAALADPSALVRRQAVRLLGEARSATPWDALAARLGDSDDDVRHEAALALARIDAARAAPLLRAHLSSSREADQIAALDAIGEHRVPGLAAESAAELRSASPRVRTAAARALAHEGAAADDALIDALGDVEEQVRLAVLDVLAQREKIPIAALTPLLGDASATVRLRALNLLRRRSDSGACAAVLRLLDDPVPLIRRGAMLTLGLLECSDARAALLDAAARMTDDADRVALLNALGRIGGGEALALTREAISDPSPRVRREAIAAYSSLAGAAAVDTVAALLFDDPADAVRAAAAVSLGGIGGPATWALLSVALEDRNPRVRQVAARGLLGATTERAIAALLAALRDPDPEVRQAVVRSLGRSADRMVIPALIALREQERDRRVLAEAAGALAALDPGSFAADLAPADAAQLHDPFRTGAAYTIWLRDPSWYPASERVLFYNTGIAETLDAEDQGDTYRYFVESDELRVTTEKGGAAAATAFQVDTDLWTNSAGETHPCRRLRLAVDPFAVQPPRKETVLFAFPPVR